MNRNELELDTLNQKIMLFSTQDMKTNGIVFIIRKDTAKIILGYIMPSMTR